MKEITITEEKAFEGFMSGTNCCMAVFSQSAELLGFDVETAQNIAAALGAGMGIGSTCCCVTGAFMALGFKYGAGEELDAKKAEFIEKFTAQFKSCNCPEILGGLNPAVGDDMAEIMDKDLMHTVCAPAVCAACAIVKELIDE